MDLSFETLPVLLGWAIVLFFVYSLLYYKFIYSLIDPVFTWIFTTAFASVLVVIIVPDLKDKLHFFGCQFALWFGFLLAYKNTFKKKNSLNSILPEYIFSDLKLLHYISYLLFSLYVFSNIIIAYSKGFALLSDAPSEAKIANFQQGFGLFRKINWSTGTFVTISFVFLYLIEKKRKYVFLFLIVTLFHSLEGSKSALLQTAISVGIVFYHPAFSNRNIQLKAFQRYLPLIFLSIIGVFFTVLIKENDGYDEALLSFIRRLLYSADSVLYYYTPTNIAYFENYTFSDYISRLVDPLLGFFRIRPYQEALGNTMFDNLRTPGVLVTSVTVGPNSPFYIEGRIFFYFWPAFFYSTIVGYLYAIIRIRYFSITRTSALYFVYMGSFCQIAYAIIIDVNLAVTQLFDLIFFVGIPAIIMSLLLKKRLSFRLDSNLNKFLTNTK